MNEERKPCLVSVEKDLLEKILAMAMWESCMYKENPKAKPTTHCCDWNEIVELIQVVLKPEIPDHLPDTKKMVSPGTSVVTWHRYDGTPETLPEPHRLVIVSRKDESMVTCIAIGDLWAYMPTPPEGTE